MSTFKDIHLTGDFIWDQVVEDIPITLEQSSRISKLTAVCKYLPLLKMVFFSGYFERSGNFAGGSGGTNFLMCTYPGEYNPKINTGLGIYANIGAASVSVYAAATTTGIYMRMIGTTNPAYFAISGCWVTE